MKIFLLLLSFAIALIAQPALAAVEPVLIGSSEDWKAYHFLEGGQKVCFMTLVPQKQEGKYNKRGDVSFFVTHWPDEKNNNAVSFSNGYTFKPESQVALTVGDKKYDLFTQGDMAWTKDRAMDDVIVNDLQAAPSMIVTGTSSRGTLTTDTYNLKGASDAYQMIVRECAIQAKTGGTE